MASETSILRAGKVVLFPGEGEVVFDPVADLTIEAVRHGLLATSVQRIFREITAGKTDTPEDRAKAIARAKARYEGWKNGLLELPRGEAVKLTDAETADAIFGYVLSLKRAKGDKRPEAQLRKAWNDLGAEKQAEVVKIHEKGIKKVLAARLKAKRKPGADIDL